MAWLRSREFCTLSSRHTSPRTREDLLLSTSTSGEYNVVVARSQQQEGTLTVGDAASNSITCRYTDVRFGKQIARQFTVSRRRRCCVERPTCTQKERFASTKIRVHRCEA